MKKLVNFQVMISKIEFHGKKTDFCTTFFAHSDLTKKLSSTKNRQSIWFHVKIRGLTLRINSGSNSAIFLHKSMIFFLLSSFGFSKFGFPTREILTNLVNDSCKKKIHFKHSELYKRCSYSQCGKFMIFLCITQILREIIKLGDSKRAKSAFFAELEALNFDFH